MPQTQYLICNPYNQQKFHRDELMPIKEDVGALRTLLQTLEAELATTRATYNRKSSSHDNEKRLMSVALKIPASMVVRVDPQTRKAKRLVDQIQQHQRFVEYKQRTVEVALRKLRKPASAHREKL